MEKHTKVFAQPAQALVEFALSLPVLLLLVLGLVNIGLLINAQIAVTQSAWEGARAGAIISDPAQGDQEIVGAVKRSVPGFNADLLQIDIDPQQDETPRDQPWPAPRGSPITVTVSYPMTLFIPVAVNVSVSARAVSRMEYQNP